MDKIRLILASQSPRRRALIELLGYPFDVLVSNVDEDEHMEHGPAAYVLHTAARKAEAVAALLPAGVLPAVDLPAAERRVIIAADTTVALDEAILGKPASAAEAREMLVALRGRDHIVYTAVAVIDVASGRGESFVEPSVVTMRDYSDDEIAAYIAGGDPFDKAGGYAIQHAQFHPAAALSGCYLGVMGLSLCRLIPLLRQFDVPDRFDPARLVDAHEGVLHNDE